VRQCSKLVHLNIWSFALQGDGFQSFFAGPPHHMQRLESLQLTSLECADVPSAGYVATFSSLPSLRSIRLVDCTRVDSLLPHLRSVAALRYLTLEVRHTAPGADARLRASSDSGSDQLSSDMSRRHPTRAAFVPSASQRPVLRCGAAFAAAPVSARA
jgi:hypothetical protein